MRAVSAKDEFKFSACRLTVRVVLLTDSATGEPFVTGRD